MTTKNTIALEFVRFVLKRNPEAHDFGAIYDAMSRAASSHSFRNLGYDELSVAGISFSLNAVDSLEELIDQARKLDREDE
ncbi:MAG: hypothetical protein ACE5H9_13855 [Anaerolineae bacterium]